MKDNNNRVNTDLLESLPYGADLNDAQIFIMIPESDYVIDLDVDISEPPMCLGILEGTKSRRLFTYGNISMSNGKAKSRKSFLVSLLLAAFHSKDENFQDFFIGPKEKKSSILFDTEQSIYDVQKVARRVPKLLDENINEYYVYATRTADTEHRLIELENAIKRHKKELGLVVIDGIADLVMNINDRAECVEVITMLMQWSTIYNVHIHTILHENKGDSNARGHLGTELTNKCETVLGIKIDSNDKMNSVIEGKYTRGAKFNDFILSVDQDTILPFVNTELSFLQGVNTKRRKNKAAQPSDFEPKVHMTLLKDVFELQKFYSSTNIHSSIILAFQKIGKHISRDGATLFRTHYVNEGYLVPKHDSPTHPRQSYRFRGDEMKFEGWSFSELQLNGLNNIRKP